MDSGEDLFLRVIQMLDAGGVLQQLVLVGNWVLPVYRTHFDGNPEVPLMRTTDIDILVGTPAQTSKAMDVPAGLARLGFEPMWALQGGYCKYVHPEMEVDFLIPEKGRGTTRAVTVKNLRVEAQPLRYLTLAYERSMLVQHRGFNIRVPEPEVFVVLKLLVIPRRKDKKKAERDARTARALGEFLMADPARYSAMKDLIHALPRGWQKTIRQSARERVPSLLELLSD